MDEETTKKLSYVLAKSCVLNNTDLEPLAKGEVNKITITKDNIDNLLMEIAKNIYTVLKHPQIEKLQSFWFPESWEELQEDTELLKKLSL